MKGRGNRHVVTTGEATRLELNYLIKNKCLQKGRTIQVILSWSNGNKMNAECVYTENDIYVRLSYALTNSETKELTNYDYKIYIAKKASNLGKGEVLYFVCPESALYCRTLFMCYGYYRFKHRLAYQNKIYYNSQTHSKDYRLNGRFFSIEKKLNTLLEKRNTETYKGKPTKRYLKNCALIDKRNEIDNLRNEQFENWLLKKIRFNL